MEKIKLEINWKAETEDYITYEFSTDKELFIEESDTDVDLFRLFIKPDGSTEVFVANYGDYDICEEVTHHFDGEAIKLFCINESVMDMTDDYMAYYEN
jgi:hypothetical protein